jgi:hypothetical protein
MRHHGPLPSVLLLILGNLVACFDPSGGATTEDGTGTDSSGTLSTAGPSSSATTGPSSSDATEPESGSEASSNATSEGDAPPEITSLTINGDGTPMPVTSGSRLLLAAEAADDLGIDRIEFYDGRTLLGVAEAPPYEASTIVTSANNGEHMYRAVAYDTADQNDEAWLDVSVDIEGGSVVAIHEQVLGLALDDAFGGMPYVAVGQDGDVHLVSSELAPTKSGSVRRLAYLRFDANLNLVDSGAYPAAVTDSTPAYGTYSPGALTQDGSYFVHILGGFGLDPLLVAFDTTTTTGQTGLSVEGTAGGVAVDDKGNVYAGIGAAEVRGITADFASSHWNTPLPDGATHLVGGPDYVVADCRRSLAGADEMVVRRISSTGAIEWTQTVGSLPDDYAARPGVSVVERQSNTIATVFRDTMGDVRMQLRDPKGNSLDAFELGDPVNVPYSMASDPQGALLIGGANVGPSTDEVLGEIWLARYALDGAELWSTDLSTGFEPGGNWISSVAIGPDGAAYVTGAHNQDPGPAPNASLWIARVEL